MCVTERHDKTLAIKVALNLNTTNKPTITCIFVRGFTPYQQYFSYLMATVQKSMLPGPFLTST